MATAAAVLPRRRAHAVAGSGPERRDLHVEPRTARPGAGAALSTGVILTAGHPALSGVRLGADEASHTARLFGTAFGLHEAVATGGAVRAAAERMIADGNATVLIGGATAVDADVLADVARARGVLFLNIGTAPDALSHRCDAHTFHVQPSAAVRDAALRQVAHAPPSARAVLWHPSLTRFGAGQINDRYRDATGQPMSEHAWAGWFAVKTVFESAQRVDTMAGAALAAHLAAPRTVFDGHKGVQLSFRPDTHELRQPLYIVVDDEVVAEVPDARDAAGRSPGELLDSLVPDGGSCA